MFLSVKTLLLLGFIFVIEILLRFSNINKFLNLYFYSEKYSFTMKEIIHHDFYIILNYKNKIKLKLK